MTIDDKIRDEQLKYDINREAAKILAFSSGKIDQFKYMQVSIYCLLTKDGQQNKLSLHTFLQEKLLKNKQKQLKTKEKNK